MFDNLKNRLSRFIDNCIKQRIDTIATVAAGRVDLGKIAMLVPFDRARFMEEIIGQVKPDHAIEYETLAEHVSIEDLAQQFDVADIAGEVDHSEIASALDTSDIAGEISVSDLAGELDAEDIAGHIDLSDVADYIDYQKLAVALLHAVKSGAL